MPLVSGVPGYRSSLSGMHAKAMTTSDGQLSCQLALTCREEKSSRGVSRMCCTASRLFHLLRSSQLAGRPLPMSSPRKGITCRLSQVTNLSDGHVHSQVRYCQRCGHR